MATPPTVAAAGYYVATRAGAPAGEAIVRMTTATKGTFSLGASQWTLVADPATKKLRGTKAGSVVDLKITNRNTLSGAVDGDALQLTRAVLRPIPPAEAAQSDAGPTGAIKAVMDATPDYQHEVGDATTFWYAFGPVLYRGRLDGSARVLCVASDPGPSECLPFVRRTLIGDSGQKTQGLLAKLGLTRSYVLVNGSAVAMRPSQASKGLKILKTNVAITSSRHALYNSLLTASVQAIVVLGIPAHELYDVWAASNPAVKKTKVFKLPHPAAVDRDGSGHDAALIEWATAVKSLRKIVTPDADGNASTPNYGAFFTEMDYARIPRWDLPSTAPLYAGDDSWGRAATPRHNNCCARPSPDDLVSLVLTQPPGQVALLQYEYKAGKLVGTKGKDGKNAKVNAIGLPV
ncbi:MAG: hypothetical protein ABJE47_08700 [bacterium]